MKNRAMLLCLENNILTVEEYAKKIGVSDTRAKEILEQKVILTQLEIDINCRVFNVRPDYFLALVEA